MSLTVEDGTGVTGADAFISLADAEALYLARQGEACSGTDVLKEAAIRRATAFVDSLKFTGSRTNGRAQPLAWPREDVYDRDGNLIPKDELPIEVANATALFAFVELTSPGALTPEVVKTDRVKREKVGSIEVEFAGFSNVDAARTVVTAAMDLLQGLIISSNTRFIGRA